MDVIKIITKMKVLNFDGGIFLINLFYHIFIISNKELIQFEHSMHNLKNVI